jgi:hypothetical protein
MYELTVMSGREDNSSIRLTAKERQATEPETIF